MQSREIEEEKEKCACKNCKGVHRVIYSPGACEAVVKCSDCGQLYYSLLFEQMGFGREDILEEYQIPISEEELECIKQTEYKDLDLSFLKGREARCLLSPDRITKLDAESALKRCGRN